MALQNEREEEQDGGKDEATVPARRDALARTVDAITRMLGD